MEPGCTGRHIPAEPNRRRRSRQYFVRRRKARETARASGRAITMQAEPAICRQPRGFLRYAAPAPDISDAATPRHRKQADVSYCYRSEEHTSELQSLMRISYAVFCLKKKTKTYNNTNEIRTISEQRHT